jgi:hypothetical protein
MFTLTLHHFDCVQTPVCNGQGHKHYSEFISGLRFRIWNLQAVAPILKSFNRKKETTVDVFHITATQDCHSSLGTLRYYLQFSVMYEDVEMAVSCISGLM